MSKDKKRKIRLVTPEGVAKFPWLTEPDTRFNDAGEYSVQLILPEEDEKTQELITKIDAIWDEFKKGLTGAKAKRQPDSLGYDKEYDADGSETGYMVFKFKAKTGYIGKETGKWVPLPAPKIFDAKLKEIPEGTAIWGGSVIIVNFSPEGYDHGKNLGVTLRLNAVQIIELRNGASGANAGAYGFEAQDGFAVGSEMEEEIPEEDDGDVDTDAENDEDDF